MNPDYGSSPCSFHKILAASKQFWPINRQGLEAAGGFWPCYKEDGFKIKTCETVEQIIVGAYEITFTREFYKQEKLEWALRQRYR